MTVPATSADAAVDSLRARYPVAIPSESPASATVNALLALAQAAPNVAPVASVPPPGARAATPTVDPGALLARQLTRGVFSASPVLAPAAPRVFSPPAISPPPAGIDVDVESLFPGVDRPPFRPARSVSTELPEPLVDTERSVPVPVKKRVLKEVSSDESSDSSDSSDSSESDETDELESQVVPESPRAPSSSVPEPHRQSLVGRTPAFLGSGPEPFDSHSTEPVVQKQLPSVAPAVSSTNSPAPADLDIEGVPLRGPVAGRIAPVGVPGDALRSATCDLSLFGSQVGEVNKGRLVFVPLLSLVGANAYCTPGLSNAAMSALFLSETDVRSRNYVYDLFKPPTGYQAPWVQSVVMSVRLFFPLLVPLTTLIRAAQLPCRECLSKDRICISRHMSACSACNLLGASCSHGALQRTLATANNWHNVTWHGSTPPMDWDVGFFDSQAVLYERLNIPRQPFDLSHYVAGPNRFRQRMGRPSWLAARPPKPSLQKRAVKRGPTASPVARPSKRVRASPRSVSESEEGDSSEHGGAGASSQLFGWAVADSIPIARYGPRRFDIPNHSFPTLEASSYSLDHPRVGPWQRPPRPRPHQSLPTTVGQGTRWRVAGGSPP